MPLLNARPIGYPPSFRRPKISLVVPRTPGRFRCLNTSQTRPQPTIHISRKCLSLSIHVCTPFGQKPEQIPPKYRQEPTRSSTPQPKTHKHEQSINNFPSPYLERQDKLSRQAPPSFDDPLRTQRPTRSPTHARRTQQSHAWPLPSLSLGSPQDERMKCLRGKNRAAEFALRPLRAASTAGGAQTHAHRAKSVRI